MGLRGGAGSKGVGHVPGIAPGRRRQRRGRQQCRRQQIAGYILFATVDGRDYAVTIELKKSFRSGDRTPYCQLRATRPIVAYLESLARNEGRSAGAIVVRHVVVASESGGLLPKTFPRARFVPAGCRWSERDISGLRFVGEQLPFRALTGSPEDRAACPEESWPRAR